MQLFKLYCLSVAFLMGIDSLSPGAVPNQFASWIGKINLLTASLQPVSLFFLLTSSQSWLGIGFLAWGKTKECCMSISILTALRELKGPHDPHWNPHVRFCFFCFIGFWRRAGTLGAGMFQSSRLCFWAYRPPNASLLPRCCWTWVGQWDVVSWTLRCAQPHMRPVMRVPYCRISFIYFLYILYIYIYIDIDKFSHVLPSWLTPTHQPRYGMIWLVYLEWTYMFSHPTTGQELPHAVPWLLYSARPRSERNWGSANIIKHP